MTLNSTQMLKQLEPAVRPGVAPASRGTTAGSLETQSFEQLLSMASRGQVSSGRQIDTAIDLEPPLDPAQLERLASAADQAEAAGSKRALMMIDGRGVVLDVKSRTIVGELGQGPSRAVSGIDSAMLVGSEDDALSGAQLTGPHNFVMPPELALQLEKHANQGAAHGLQPVGRSARR